MKRSDPNFLWLLAIFLFIAIFLAPTIGSLINAITFHPRYESTTRP